MKERDEDFGRRFGEMRAWDRRNIPSFDAVVRRSRRLRSRVPLLAAAALVIGVAVLLVLSRPREGRSETGIAMWQSPTASLLVIPGSDLLHTVPSLSESVIHLEEQ